LIFRQKKTHCRKEIEEDQRPNEIFSHGMVDECHGRIESVNNVEGEEHQRQN
jgi:hypothetical protein